MVLGKVTFLIIFLLRQAKFQCVTLGNRFREELNLELRKLRIPHNFFENVSQVRFFSEMESYEGFRIYKQYVRRDEKVEMLEFSLKDPLLKKNYLFLKSYFTEE